MKTELTPAEEQLAIEVRDQWIDLALAKNVEGINEEKFETGITWLYDKFLSLPKPQVIYCEGLVEAIIKITLIKDYGKELEDYTPDMVEKFNNKGFDEEFMAKFKENSQLKSTYCGWSNFGWVSF